MRLYAGFDLHSSNAYLGIIASQDTYFHMTVPFKWVSCFRNQREGVIRGQI